MISEPMISGITILVLVAEAVILWLLQRMLRAFGAYTEAFMKAHESDRIVHQQAIKILEYAEELLRKEKSA